MANTGDNQSDPLKLTLGPSISEQPPATSATPANPLRRQKRRRTDKAPDETIPAPYPWATDRPCRLHTVSHLKRNGHTTVTGNVKCKKCHRSYEMAFELEKRFYEIGFQFLKNKDEMRNRATREWKNPTLPDCRLCGQKNAASPEIAGLEKTNWLFLFLGEMIGCCNLQDLKYFLLQNGIHRTAGKDWLLYYVYLSILEQLDPNAPFGL